MASMLCFRSIAVSVGLAIVSAACGAAAEEYVPWSLRDFYTFSGDKAALKYAVHTAEWMIEVEGLGVVFQDVQAEIELADGTRSRLAELELLKDEREKLESVLGEGSVFRSVFKPREGLAVRMSVARFSQRPYLVLYMDVANVSDRPIDIAALRPAVLPAGSIRNLPAGHTVDRVRAGQRGIAPMADSKPYASLVRFELKQPPVTLGLGVLQSGKMESGVDLARAGDVWQGAVVSRCAPPRRIQPGERIEADAVWVSFGTPDPVLVQQFYSWAQTVTPGPLTGWAIPRGWVAAGDGASADGLLQLAQLWSGSPVNHLLVPATWEGRPGSLEAASPAYPKNMKELAERVKKLGMRPGLSLEPLEVDGGDASWTAPSPNGARWLNARHPEAWHYGVQRLVRTMDWGFDFYVVNPSPMPDEVLRGFGLTREEADTLAFEMVVAAAPGRPVLPAPTLTLGAGVEEWREVLESTYWLKEYGAAVGPVRVDTESISAIPDTLKRILEDFSAPIELVGRPASAIRAELGESLAPKKAVAGTVQGTGR